MLERYVLASVLALSTGVLAGCEVDESVVLEARIENPALEVRATALTTEVTGGFELELSLGDYGSDPTSVKLGPFSLKRGGEVLLSPLDLSATPQFPITVDVGSSEHVEVEIANSEGDSALAAVLCAGELQITGSLTDSLTDDRPRPVTSSSFLPECP